MIVYRVWWCCSNLWLWIIGTHFDFCACRQTEIFEHAFLVVSSYSSISFVNFSTALSFDFNIILYATISTQPLPPLFSSLFLFYLKHHLRSLFSGMCWPLGSKWFQENTREYFSVSPLFFPVYHPCIIYLQLLHIPINIYFICSLHYCFTLESCMVFGWGHPDVEYCCCMVSIMFLLGEKSCFICLYINTSCSRILNEYMEVLNENRQHVIQLPPIPKVPVLERNAARSIFESTS